MIFFHTFATGCVEKWKKLKIDKKSDFTLDIWGGGGGGIIYKTIGRELSETTQPVMVSK